MGNSSVLFVVVPQHLSSLVHGWRSSVFAELMNAWLFLWRYSLPTCWDTHETVTIVYAVLLWAVLVLDKYNKKSHNITMLGVCSLKINAGLKNTHETIVILMFTGSFSLGMGSPYSFIQYKVMIVTKDCLTGSADLWMGAGPRNLGKIPLFYRKTLGDHFIGNPRSPKI